MKIGEMDGVAWRRTLVIVALGLVLGWGILTTAAAQNDLLNMQQDPGQWVMANHGYDGWNYSPLDRINTYNVKNLAVQWTFQIGVTDSLEAEPLVVGNTMYILTPKPNNVYALDLSRNGYIKWSFQPDMPGLDQATACCGAQSRGLAYADGKIFFTTLDGQMFALNADTGEQIWQTQVTDLSLTETTTSALTIIGDKVITGVEGGERGIRGYVAAYDINSGDEQWRFYSTGPDAEMGIGDRFAPYYAADKVDTPGTSTWYGDSWKNGGGSVWGFFTYSPSLNLFYYGTGNCGPWNPDYRRDPATAPGTDQYTSKYCASVLARDGDTGELVWAYQTTPQDQWDYDEPGNQFLVNMTVDGQQRYALVKSARNGYFYAWDAATGELLYQPQKYTTVTWSDHIDLSTGMPVYNPDNLVYTGTQTKSQVCPFIAGNNWFNDAYSPKTGLVYFQSENRCNMFTGSEGEYKPGDNYVLMDFGTATTGPGGYQGELQAWDPATGKKVWGVKSQEFRDNKPVLATGGNLVFGGTDQGYVRAMDARTGEQLWTFRTGSDFRNSPITYVGPDGKQYLAVITSHAPDNSEIGGDVAPDDAGRYRRTGSTLYVFALP